MGQVTTTGRERILTAARKLFAARGFDSVTIRDIGEEAGLTNPALYRHFADKEALGVELYRQCYARMLDEIENATAAAADPLAKLENYVCAVADLFETQRDLVLYVDEHQVRFWPSVRAAFEGRTLSERVGAWIRAARRSGAIPTAPSVTMQVALVMGFVSHWFAMRATDLVKREPPRALAAYVRGALMGSNA